MNAPRMPEGTATTIAVAAAGALAWLIVFIADLAAQVIR